MSGKVLSLGRATIPGEPCVDVVEKLEELLAEARAGDLRGFAYVSVNLNGSLGTGWVGADGTRWPLGAGVGILLTRYSTALADKS